MQCPLCNGSGVNPIPHIPANRGLPNTLYPTSDSACGGCEGRGQLSGEPNGKRNLLGQIMGYDAKTQTASMLLASALRSGDRIVVEMEAKQIELEVEVIQWGKAWVHLARRGWVITINTPSRVGSGAKVYRAA